MLQWIEWFGSLALSFQVLSVFIIALCARLVAVRGIVTGFDESGHLYYSKLVHQQKTGPFGSILLDVVNPAPFFNLFLWNWLIGFLPEVCRTRYKKLVNPTLDAIFTALLFLIALSLDFSIQLSVLSAALYIFTPMWFSRLVMGPRIDSLTPRLSAEIATNLFFVVVCLPIDVPYWALLLGSGLLAGYVLASSKFGVQALLFLTPLVSIFLTSWLPLVALAFGVLIVTAASRGAFANSLKQQLAHLHWYFLKNLNGGMAVSDRNRFNEVYKRKAAEPSMHYFARLLVMLIERNAYTGFFIKLPVLWVSLTILVIWPNVDIAIFYWAPVAAACIMFILINIPQLLFLGEAERYLNHIACFIILVGVMTANASGHLWLYWALVLYGMLYLAVEAIALPALNRKSLFMDEEDEKIIDYLSSMESSVVLSFPYHAGGGVYRIMADTPHYTICPFGTTDEFVQKLEKKYGECYPYVDLTRLDDMRNELGVKILVARLKGLQSKLGADWEPGPGWKKVDLGLKLQCIFVYQND